MPKNLNPNLVKIHRSYLVEEIAALFNLHKNTVRNWVKEGLPINDDLRPMLILGCDLREFLKQRKAKQKRPCKFYEFYCLKCRAPKKPAGNMAEYLPMSETRGRLTAICPSCYSIMNRYTDLDKLTAISTELEVTRRENENT